jgi:hypothetical protein
MNPDWAFVRNCGNHPVAWKPSAHKESTSKVLSRDGNRWGGGTRSSFEITVMVMEQRGVVNRVFVLNNCKQDDL